MKAALLPLTPADGPGNMGATDRRQIGDSRLQIGDNSAVEHRFQANARDGAICRSRVKRLQNHSIEENEA